MLPGSECGEKSICHLDKCVLKSDIESHLKTEYITETLDLTKHCTSDGDVNVLKDSNTDRRESIQCIDWEDDVLCESSQSCPDSNDNSVLGLYIKHVCCKKCSSSLPTAAFAAFNQSRKNRICSIIISISLFFSYIKYFIF